LSEQFSSELRLRIGILSNKPVGSSRGEKIDYISEAEVEEQVVAVEDSLKRLGLMYERFNVSEDFAGLVSWLKERNPDVVINLCEEALGDSHFEMDVPALLELLRFSYTGSPPLTLGLCQDKGLTKSILESRGLPTPKYQTLRKFEDWEGQVCYPLFVKPLREDASLGITKESYVKNEAELRKRVEYITERYNQPALVEEYIRGRELNVSILGDKDLQILPISEIVFGFTDEPRIVDYSAKWIDESEEYKKTIPVCPAELDIDIRRTVESVALRAYVALQCRDYARVDIRLKNGTPYVLEVNPNPDISPQAGFARSLKAAGIPYEDFVNRLVMMACKRRAL
jgi:D-alanine-D-alanine ligase